MKNDLKDFYLNQPHNKSVKFEHYFDIYEKQFASYRNEEINFLEIGVWHGGSIQMWDSYFGPKTTIYGLDINPLFETDNPRIKLFKGDQSSEEYLEQFISETPMFDIILDDGGHSMEMQITSFNHLFKRVKPGGLYMVEDTHSSYWVGGRWGGGLKSPSSFIEQTKMIPDHLHEWYWKGHNIMSSEDEVSNYCKEINSITYYDSIVVIEKSKEIKKQPYILPHK